MPGQVRLLPRQVQLRLSGIQPGGVIGPLGGAEVCGSALGYPVLIPEELRPAKGVQIAANDEGVTQAVQAGTLIDIRSFIGTQVGNIGILPANGQVEPPVLSF